MYLETDRIVVRDFSINDLDDLHEILGDSEVMLYTEPAYDKEKTGNFLRTFCMERKGAFAAVLKDTGKAIGYILFKSVNEPEVYEIGWIFNKSYWRKGYAFESCNRLINYAFEDMKLHKICAEAIDKEKSVPLMIKLGMTLEGVQRKHTKSNEGAWCDLHLYSTLEEDYFCS